MFSATVSICRCSSNDAMGAKSAKAKGDKSEELIAAAIAGKTSEVKELLTEGLDVDQQDSQVCRQNSP
jgi:hypothetical protein